MSEGSSLTIRIIDKSTIDIELHLVLVGVSW
jgi:hypothetical protein